MLGKNNYIHAVSIYIANEWLTPNPPYPLLCLQAVQWLRPQLMMQGVRVWSQGGKLRSHMTHGPKNQNIKQKQNCNKLNKDFNSGGWVSRLFLAVATPWTVAGQDPLPTAFPRPEYWSGLPFCSSGNLPDPRIELNVSCTAGRFFTTGAREDRWSTSKNL